jgi:Pentapeptide repeats (9 copies)
VLIMYDGNSTVIFIMTSSSESAKGSVPISDGVNQPNSGFFRNRTPAEDPDVAKIRAFFDRETKHLKVDKLSQAYLAIKFTQDDVRKLRQELGDREIAQILNLDNLQSMFRAYCEDPQFSPNPDFPKELLNPEEWKKWHEDRHGNVLGPWMLKVLLKAGIVTTVLTAIVGTGSSVLNLGGTERAKYFQAWQVINSAKGQPGMAGRNEALKYLNKDTSIWYAPECKKHSNCLVGIKIEEANLEGVDLEDANLKSSELKKTSFRDANLRRVKFEEANLEDAVFKSAKLQGAVFKNANLKGAVFYDADLTGADTETAGNIKYAKFCRTIMPNGKQYDRDCKLEDFERSSRGTKNQEKGK